MLIRSALLYCIVIFLFRLVISLGYINASNWTDYKEWIGGSIGIKGKYQLAEDFGISAAATWLYSESPEFKVADVKQKFTASYLEIPILASYDINEHVGIQVGIKPAIQTGFKNHMENSNTKVDQDADGVEKFQMYVPIGLTYQFNSPLSLGFHYNFPITKINKEKVDDNIKFNQFMLTLGWDL